MKNTTNVFLKGMTSDMHPLTISQLEYTDALNATLITFNGNELMMQNDMGNTKIQDTKTGNIMGLREGFIPVGLKEHGGIMYIASVNKDGVGEIGTIPSPVIRYNQENQIFDKDNIPDTIDFASGSILSNVYPLTDVKLKPQEKFLVNIPGTLSEISSLAEKKYYKIKLFSKTDNSIIDISDAADSNAYYIKTGENSAISDYWFLNLDANTSLDFDRMLALDGTKDPNSNDLKILNYFIHYPNIAEGYPAIAFEKENILSFDLVENHAQNARYPILLEEEDEEHKKWYKICIYGFLFSTESFVEVDKMTIKISDEENELIRQEYTSYGKLETTPFAKMELSLQGNIPQEFLILRTGGYTGWINNIKSLPTAEELASYPPELLSLNIGSDCNKWFTITVDYYCSKWENDKIGTYSFRYNPYLIDVLKTHIIGSSWEPHSFSLGTSFRQYFDVKHSDEEIIERPLNGGNEVTGDRIDLKTSPTRMFKDNNVVFSKDYSLLEDENTEKKFYPKNDASYHVEWDVLYNSQDITPINVSNSEYLNLPLDFLLDREDKTIVKSIFFSISLQTSGGHNLRNGYEYYLDNSYIKIEFSNMKINGEPIYINSSDSFSVTTNAIPEKIGSERLKYGFKFYNYSYPYDYPSNFIITDRQDRPVEISSDFIISCDIIAKCKNVRWLFPNSIYDELVSELKIIPTVFLTKTGYSGHYITQNASNYYVFPQFDYYITLVEGQEQTTYPGFLSQTNTPHVCPIILKNYLSLSGAETTLAQNNPSYRMDELGVDVYKTITDRGETIFSDNLKKGLYLLITNKSGLHFKCTIENDTSDKAQAFLINLNKSKRVNIDAFNVVPNMTNTYLVSAGLYEINTGLIKKLPENEIVNLGDSIDDAISDLADNYGIYPLSVFLYGENVLLNPVHLESWIQYNLDGSTSILESNKTYLSEYLPAEGFQNMYLRCYNNKYTDPNIGIDITFRTT